MKQVITVGKLIELLSKEDQNATVLIAMTFDDKSSTTGIPLSDMYTGIWLGKNSSVMLVADERERHQIYE